MEITALSPCWAQPLQIDESPGRCHILTKHRRWALDFVARLPLAFWPVMPKHGGLQGTSHRRPQLRQRERRHNSPWAVVATVALVALPALAIPATTAEADVGSDQAQISALEQKIAQEGAEVQDLVVTYDQAQTAEAVAANRVVAAQARLTADEKTEDQALTVLRAIALTSYMTDSQNDSSLAIFSTATATSAAAEQEYTQIANQTLRDAVDAVDVDIRATQVTETQLRSAQAQAQANLDTAAAAKSAAQSQLAQDDALLAQVKGNLAALLEQEQAQQQAQEQAMAAAQAAANPVNIIYTPSPGTYVDPLSAINDLTPERVDQGVDYSGYGPIAAVGDGQVLSTANSGWPGGTFIAYKLTDGPAAGLVVYAAEDIEPLVSVGQSVTAGQTLGTMYEGPDGIETGWADPSGDGVTMARDYGQFSGANSTAFGANFSQLLASVGAPPGVMQNEPATGSLPPNWPQW